MVSKLAHLDLEMYENENYLKQLYDLKGSISQN